MAEKRRATTFVTSRGAIVNVAYPDIYIAPSISPTDLREELAVDEPIASQHMLLRDLNALFRGRMRPFVGGVVGDQQRPDADTYLDGLRRDKGATIPITKPAGYRYLAFYSKKMFSYPYMHVKCVLPTVTVGTVWLGYEPEGAPDYGNGYFMYGVPDAKLYACLAWKTLDITSLLPVNATTTQHSYIVKLDKDSTWFYIDGSLVAIGFHNTFDFNIAGPPYYLFGSVHPHMPIQPSFIEIDTLSGEAMSWYVSKWVTLNGDPKPPRPLDLYQSGVVTKMRAAVIAAGSLTSHPFPLLGYNSSTVHFQANQNGTLLVQVYTLGGSWRTYNTAGEDQSTVANTLYSYTILGSAVLGRVVFTPSAYPATIAEAEVMLQ